MSGTETELNPPERSLSRPRHERDPRVTNDSDSGARSTDD